MKRWFLFILVFSFSKAFSQNEFAASVFYNDFRKIHTDALAGFSKYKGSKKQGGNDAAGEEYRIKLLLPLADSGHITFPAIEKPYAEFFFQTATTKKQIDQRAVNLREALLIAYEQPLGTRTESSLVKGNIFSNTYFFTKQDENLAVFKMSIYQVEKKFYLTLRMMGE